MRTRERVRLDRQWPDAGCLGRYARLPGARCELVNDKGRFFVNATPGTVSLTRSYNNLQVTCTRDGVTSAPISVASATKPMAFGNILFGGIIGAGVDVGTGAAYDYPQMITVPMDCGTGAVAKPIAGPPRLGLQVESEAGGGVRVVAVEPDRPAATAGLRTGDVIVQINGTPVDAPATLAALLSDPNVSPPWQFSVRRDGQQQVLTVQPAPSMPPPAGAAVSPPRE